MPVRVGINGFGRIGRLVWRVLWEDPDVEIVHVNEWPGSCESSAYLAKFDTVHGTWSHDVECVDGALVVDGKSKVGYSSSAEPGGVDWAGAGVAVVLECSGQFLDRKSLAPYFDRGVKKVVVSAPVKDADPVLNIVYGINHSLYDPAKDHIVTAASCTTNCLAPVVQVVLENFGIVRGSITTIHNVTNTQMLMDAPNKKKSDLRRARSGKDNLCPTSTGSATAIALIFPELKGKLNGHAVRVPLTNASLTDSVFELPKATTPAEVNAAFKAASEGKLKGILGYEERPLVSSDYTNDTRSGIVDAASTMVVDGTHLKVYTWYDNEQGYSSRMADVARMVCRSI
mmetsp:Transcript_23076/g.78612  ORF Transcript_23076/g.78612 Transcript_23076/m.78612 type:complete len:342 (-) Transcript_23076:154-1179(-)